MKRWIVLSSLLFPAIVGAGEINVEVLPAKAGMNPLFIYQVTIIEETAGYSMPVDGKNIDPDKNYRIFVKIKPNQDVNNNGQADLPDVIHGLQIVSGIPNP